MFDFAYELFKDGVKYSLWAKDGKKGFIDCSGLITDYLAHKWIISDHEKKNVFNSTKLYQVSTPKPFSSGVRGDIVYFKALNSSINHIWVLADKATSSKLVIVDASFYNGVKKRDIPVTKEGTNYYYIVDGLKYQLFMADIKPRIETKQSTKNQQYLGVYKLTRYYSPLPTQKKWLPWEKGYHDSNNRQFKGDPSNRIAADGTELGNGDHNKVVACDKTIPLGSKLLIEGHGIVTCKDRWGAIKGKRLDMYCWVGDWAIENWGRCITGEQKVYLIK